MTKCDTNQNLKSNYLQITTLNDKIDIKWYSKIIQVALVRLISIIIGIECLDTQHENFCLKRETLEVRGYLVLAPCEGKVLISLCLINKTGAD